MEINSDFSARVLVHSNKLEWMASPMAGVDRRMLDRIGGEVARATTIVRFAPESHFSEHTHDGGEEFLVLDGIFQDEHGDYPTGSYIRNPPTSAHIPSSSNGCTILVKLWQFAPDDRTNVKIDTNKTEFLPVADRSGVSALSLFQDERETVRMERWEAGSTIELDLPDGGEFFVLYGGFTESGDTLEQGSWLRLPVGSKLNASVLDENTKIWMKLGHLPHAKPLAA